MQQVCVQSARISGSPVLVAQSGSCSCGPRLDDRLIASTKPDSLIPSRMAVLVSHQNSQVKATKSATCDSSTKNPTCPNVIRPSGCVAAKPTGTRSVVELAIEQFRKDWPLLAVRLDAMRAKAPALGAAVGRAAAGVPELVTPPSNTGVNESQPVARLPDESMLPCAGCPWSLGCPAICELSDEVRS